MLLRVRLRASVLTATVIFSLLSTSITGSPSTFITEICYAIPCQRYKPFSDYFERYDELRTTHTMVVAVPTQNVGDRQSQNRDQKFMRGAAPISFRPQLSPKRSGPTFPTRNVTIDWRN